MKYQRRKHRLNKEGRRRGLERRRRRGRRGRASKNIAKGRWPAKYSYISQNSYYRKIFPTLCNLA
jgi:hypothetical protein